MGPPGEPHSAILPSPSRLKVMVRHEQRNTAKQARMRSLLWLCALCGCAAAASATAQSAAQATRDVSQQAHLRLDLRFADLMALQDGGVLEVQLPDGTHRRERLISRLHQDGSLHLTSRDGTDQISTYTLKDGRFFATVASAAQTWAVSGDHHGSDWVTHRQQAQRSVWSDERRLPR